MTLRKATSNPASVLRGAKARSFFLLLLGWSAVSSFLLGFSSTDCTSRALAQESAPSDTKTNDGKQVTWEQLIYVPYKQLSTVFEKQKATVFMPYAEYLKLWMKSGEQPGQPPIAVVISAASYRAKIDQDVARIEAEYTVRVLGKAWSELPLKFGEAAVGDLASDGGDNKPNEKILLRATGDGTYSLLFPTAGEHKVKIQLAARVRSSPDGKSFDLEVPAVGVTKFELLIPEADQAVEVNPLLVRQPVEAAKGKETKIAGNLGAASRIGVLWHPKASIKPEMDLLASVTNHTQVSVADGLIHTDAFLRYDVLRGELTQLRVAVPKGDRILGVSSNDASVKGWKAADEANRQVVTIELLSGAKKALTLEVHTERPAPAEAFNVVGLSDNAPAAGIHALDVVREGGQLVVAKGADLLLNVEKLTGLTRIEEAEVAEQIRRPGSLAYKFYSPKVELKLSAKAVEPRVLVHHIAKFQFLDDELRSLTQLSYTIERAGLFELQLRVPEELVIDRVVGPQQIKEYPVETKDGQKVLRVVLDMKRDGAIQFNVFGHVPLDAAATTQELTMPLLEPLQVERETGQVSIFAPPAIEVATDENFLSGVQPERNADANPLVAGGTLASAWSFTRRPIQIPLKTTRRPTRLTASVATSLNAKPETADVRTTVTYHVQFAGLDTFQIAVPEALADAVQIRTAQGATVPAIKEKKKAEKAVDGWVTWTIILQREAIGDVPFEITYDLKPADGEGKKGNATLSWQQELKSVKAAGLPGEGESKAGKVELSDVYGEITVTKDKALTVTAEPAGDDLEAIDSRELSLLPQDGSLAYRYYSQPVSLKVSATKHEIQEVVETVVSKGLIEVVVDQDDKASYRCRFKLKTSERQRLRIDLPKGSEILGVLVDNKSVSPEKAGKGADDAFDSYFVSVARGGKSDEPFSVTLQFLWPINPKPFQENFGALRVSLPRIGGPKGSAVAVQQLRAVVWVPEKFSLVGTPESFIREQHLTLERALDGHVTSAVNQAELDQWIGTSSVGVADFATQGQAYSFHNLGGAEHLEVTWWKVSFASIVATLALFVLGVVLIPTTWRNRLGWVLAGVLIAVCAGLNDADTVLHGVAAARWGIVLMFALWIVQSLFGAVRKSNGNRLDWSQPFPATVSPPPEPGS
ncbi:MAG: hypothetical protein FD138_486 [Planctomycetota bacterium]|nr:MAG: hypothetical protein FD138_486 [Planctomycetota bacterium]